MPTVARRVLHVVRRFEPLVGGTERAVLDLATGQAEAGHDVVVVTADRDVAGMSSLTSLPRREAIAGIRVVRLPVVGNRRSTLTLRPDLLIGEVRRADVVHLHDLRFMTATLALACALARRPLLVHTHGLFFHTPFAARLKRLLLRTFYGPVLLASRAWVVAISSADEAALLSVLPRLRPRTVRLENALDLARFLASEWRGREGVVLAVGRLVASKGVDDLLRSLALMESRDWQLEIAGEEEAGERARLEQLALELSIANQVRFRGRFQSEDLPHLLATSAVAAFPSRAEGFGLALLEALATGTPVLARDIPAHRSLLGPALRSQLVDFADHTLVAARLDTLLHAAPGDAVALSSEERARARDFGVERLVRQMDQLYAQILAPTVG